MILVTGATGNVGRQVVSQLRAAGAGVRALTRDPDSAALPSGVDVVGADLSVPHALDACLEGVDAVFLVWPFMTADGAPAVVDAIRRRAHRVVYLSAMTVRDDVDEQPDPITAFHAEIERLIERSGLEWTFLRSGGFATNTLGWAPQIRAAGVVRWPFGAAARSLVHERDIAAVAVRTLIAGGHGRRRYALTGPQALTQVEQLHAIGEAIGRPLRYEEISAEAARREMAGQLPPAALDGALEYWSTLVTAPETVTRTVQELVGEPARTFREWATDHAGDFR